MLKAKEIRVSHPLKCSPFTPSFRPFLQFAPQTTCLPHAELLRFLKMASDLSPPAKKAVGSARQILIALEAATGSSLAEIASKYKTTPTGVKRSLEKSAREGLLASYVAAIASDLFPQALAVYHAHLAAGSLEAARDLVVKLGWISKMPAGDDKGKVSAIDVLAQHRAQQREAPETPETPETPPETAPSPPSRPLDLWDAPETPPKDPNP
jgi:DNA-binding Lrp family transcriptional regulator